MTDRKLKVLSQKEVDFYYHYGYLKGYPIFSTEEMVENEAGFQDLCRSLMPGEPPNVIKGWEKTSPFIFGLATNPTILDYVEDIIGSNILLWGTHFVCKFPGENSQTPWHQDARYWPLTASGTLTVWIAFDDSDAENSALVVVPGSHQIGLPENDPASPWGAAPSAKLRNNEFSEEDAVVIDLKLGEISLYNDNLIHATLPNHSDRRRCGLVVRYCTPDVKCDTRQWPGFQSTVVRGSDPLKLNPAWDPSNIYMAAS
jgi:ectoine hydroxylase-related dioxygenase (phytanoyl-CoA dioxygenase family)